MTRVFSGIKPTGDIHLGNLLGALANWVLDIEDHDCTYAVMDLHALTVAHDPASLAERTRFTAQMVMAAGVDPERCTFFVQSHVAAHTGMAWLLECTASMGELRRMTQFKDKSESSDFISAGLLTYPTLMASDIVVHDADRVPVGDDQRQHLELTRDLVGRFNTRYGPDTLVMPEAAIGRVAARVMDLQRPDSKMSKSDDSAAGAIMLDDEPAAVEKKFKRAVTDSFADVVHQPGDPERAGITNLLDILSAATGNDPAALASEYHQYGQLKLDTAAAVNELLAPIRARQVELAADPAELERILASGAEQAAERADATLLRARRAMGLLDAGS